MTPQVTQANVYLAKTLSEGASMTAFGGHLLWLCIETVHVVFLFVKIPPAA